MRLLLQKKQCWQLRPNDLQDRFTQWQQCCTSKTFHSWTQCCLLFSCRIHFLGKVPHETIWWHASPLFSCLTLRFSALLPSLFFFFPCSLCFSPSFFPVWLCFLSHETIFIRATSLSAPCKKQWKFFLFCFFVFAFVLLLSLSVPFPLPPQPLLSWWWWWWWWWGGGGGGGGEGEGEGGGGEGQLVLLLFRFLLTSSLFASSSSPSCFLSSVNCLRVYCSRDDAPVSFLMESDLSSPLFSLSCLSILVTCERVSSRNSFPADMFCHKTKRRYKQRTANQRDEEGKAIAHWQSPLNALLAHHQKTRSRCYKRATFIW